jgi:uncharacterized protein (TIGR02246 family)
MTGDPDVRQAIEASHAAYIRAMRDRDVDGLAQHFADDAILLPQASTIQRGQAAIRQWFGTWLPAAIFDEFSVRSEEIAVSGDTAYEVGTFRQVWATKGEPPAAYRGRYLMVWRHEPDGQWRILRDMFTLERETAPAAT